MPKNTESKQNKKDTTDWKAVATELAKGCWFALNHLKAPPGSGMVRCSSTGKFIHWRDHLANKLEKVPGLELNREDLHAMDLPRAKRRAYFKHISELRRQNFLATREAAEQASKKMVEAAMQDPQVQKALKSGARKAAVATQETRVGDKNKPVKRRKARV